MGKLFVNAQTKLKMIESGIALAEDIVDIDTVKLTFQEQIAAKVEYIKTMFPFVLEPSFTPFTEVARIHEIKMDMLQAGLYHRKNSNVDAAIINLILRAKGKKVPKRNYSWGKKWTI
jgi:hypothetical protein